MGCESSDVVRFNLEALASRSNEGSKLKSGYNLLIIEKYCLFSDCWYVSWPSPVDNLASGHRCVLRLVLYLVH